MNPYLLISILVLSHMIHEAQGIRLKKASHNHSHIKFNNDNEGSSLVKSKSIRAKEIENFQNDKRLISSSKKRSQRKHWLPRIHEDYYGPRLHKPRHH
ncbi:hypothetical protein Leryth_018555 [Lithospermum erythrorhizon]|nr:hypothetical protein Leryth_018555 [Lithospermum erythrorhizon]